MSAPSDPVPGYIPPPAGPAPAAMKKPGAEWLSALYAIILLFVFIAAFQLYFSLQEIIRTWISDQFVPVFNTVYYIIIIVVGIWLLREYIHRQ